MTKRLIKDLAIFGGAPVFPEPLHVGRPNIGDRQRFVARINDILDKEWLTNDGRYVQEFEAKIKEYVGVKHCVALCNGTIALEIAIRALALTDEVIVPSFTFISTAHALQWQGVTPLFCDIEARTHNVDLNHVEKLITARTSGIIGVHLWGRPCDIDGLQKIAKKHRIKLLFDAAHAFACSYKDTMIGGFGDVEVFSFHATKFFNSFEGGAITTNDDEIAMKVRRMKNFGFAGYDNVVSLGTNGKMTEICVAMGLTSLESMEEFVAANRRNYQEYRMNLPGIPGIQILEYSEEEKCNYQYIVLDVDDAKTGMSRDLLLRVLHAENVLARRYFYPGCHRMEPYHSSSLYRDLLLPVTQRVADSAMTLPTGQSVSPQDIRAICGILSLAIRNADKILERLPEPQSNNLPA